MIIKIMEGEPSPPIQLNLKRNGYPPQYAPGKYRVTTKVEYPDGSIEVIETDFQIVKRRAIK